MEQVLRRGLKEILVGTVPNPLSIAHHVIVSPMYSLISNRTETASIHAEELIRGAAENPTHVKKVYVRFRRCLQPLPPV